MTEPTGKPRVITPVNIAIAILLVGATAFVARLPGCSQSAPVVVDPEEKELTEAEREKRAAEADAARKKAEDIEATSELSRRNAKVLQKQAVATCEKARVRLTAGLDALRAWNEEIPPLLTNERGKYLGGEDRHVRRFLELTEGSTRPTSSELSAAVTRVHDLCSDLQSIADDDENFADASGTLAALAPETALAETAERTLEKEREEVLILADAARATSSSEPTQTLDDAIHAYKVRNAEEIARAEHERRKAAEAITKAEQDALARGKAEADAARATEDHAQNERKLGAERARDVLESEAQSPEVKARFAAVLAPGKKSLYAFKTGAFNWQLKRDAQAAPVSYNALNTIRATTEFEQFVKLMTSTSNDRPSWPKPVTDAEWANVREQFEQFKRLAPVWIELGMLTP